MTARTRTITISLEIDETDFVNSYNVAWEEIAAAIAGAVSTRPGPWVPVSYMRVLSDHPTPWRWTVIDGPRP